MPTWLAIVLGIVGGVGAASGVWWNLREKSARARLAPALEAIGRDRDEDGRVLVFETAMSRVNYELRVSNEGRKAAGRTEVVVWVPRAAEVRWASDGSGSELSGGPVPALRGDAHHC